MFEIHRHGERCTLPSELPNEFADEGAAQAYLDDLLKTQRARLKELRGDEYAQRVEAAIADGWTIENA